MGKKVNMRKLLNQIVYILTCIGDSYFKLLFKLVKNNEQKNKMLDIYVENKLHYANKMTDYTYRFVKRSDVFIPLTKEKYHKYGNISIVLTGIINDYSFLEETLKMYLSFYPQIKIIIATWYFDNPNFKKFCKDNGVIISEYEDNLPNSQYNLYRQIFLSNKGIELASGINGIDYIWKSRVDQRFYNYNTIDIFIDEMNRFPPKGKYDVKGRLIYLGHYFSWEKIYFHLCDFSLFGYKEDLLKYYDLDISSLEYHCNSELLCKIKADIEKDWKGYELNQENVNLQINALAPESFLPLQYYKRVIQNIKYNGEDYYNYLSDLSIIVDDKLVDFFWRKHFFCYQESFMNIPGHITNYRWKEIMEDKYGKI